MPLWNSWREFWNKSPFLIFFFLIFGAGFWKRRSGKRRDKGKKGGILRKKAKFGGKKKEGVPKFQDSDEKYIKLIK